MQFAVIKIDIAKRAKKKYFKESERCIMISIFDSIFRKNVKQNFQNPSDSDYVFQNMPVFSISEIKPIKNNYEVAEISYEEFTKSVTYERRKQPRKQGETRRAYTA